MRIQTLSLALVPALALTATASLTAPAPVSEVGAPLPAPELDDFTQTAAKSFGDYTGRAVLIEFFEYW